MKFSKETPAFLRYFTARFKSFTNPWFWGSLGGLLIGGFAIYQYWQHPDWLQTNSESVEESKPINQKIPNVSDEDLSAAADIDNLDLLIKEIDNNRSLSAIAETQKDNQSSELKREDSAFSRFQKQQKAKLSNPNQANSSSNVNPYTSGIDTGNKKIMELLKPPSFSSYQSTVSKTNQNSNLKGITQAQPNIIPNPVGNIYLSNRNKQPSNTSVAPSITPLSTTPVNTSGAVTNNTNSNVSFNGENPNRNISSLGTRQDIPNSQIDTTATNTNTNQFIPASSAIQSKQTAPIPINNSINSFSNSGFNSLNSSPNSNLNTNSYNNNSLTNVNPNGVNQINTNPTNLNNPNLAGTNTATLNQPVQNTVIPGLTTGANEIRREGLTTRNGNNPNSLQNNYRSYQLNSSGYNSTVPSGYQSQPQNYLSNGLNGASNPNNQNPNNSANSYNQPINNPPITNLQTPSLQPAGRLSTSEVGR